MSLILEQLILYVTKTIVISLKIIAFCNKLWQLLHACGSKLKLLSKFIFIFLGIASVINVYSRNANSIVMQHVYIQ